MLSLTDLCINLIKILSIKSESLEITGERSKIGFHSSELILNFKYLVTGSWY